MKPGDGANEFFKFELASDTPATSRPAPAAQPPRRPRIWTTLIAGIGALAVVGFIVFGPESDAEEPEAVATTTASPAHPVIEPINPVQISSPDQWLAEPTLAWTRTLADFDNARTLRPLMDRLSDLSGNTSGIVVIQVEKQGSDELAGIDAHTGEIQWHFPLPDSVRKCALLADGHQIGCIKAGATKNYITVLNAETGQPYGTTNWETDCVAYAVAGTADHLVIAGKSFTHQVPCLATGALWDSTPVLTFPSPPDDPGLPGLFPASTEPDVSQVIPEQQSAWEHDFAYVTTTDSHVLARFHDFQVVATLDLQHQFAAYDDATVTISTDLGPTLLEPEFGLDSPTTYETRALVLQPVPSILRTESATADAANRFLADSVTWQVTHVVSDTTQDVRIGTTIFRQGDEVEVTTTFNPNHRGEPPGGVTVVPDGQLAIVSEVIEAENPLLADYAETYGRAFTLDTETLLSAYDTSSAEKLWTASESAALVNPIYRGDAQLWTVSMGTESQIRALDLTTGEWRWALDNKPTKLDAADANWFTTFMVGDVLVQPAHNAIDGFSTDADAH